MKKEKDYNFRLALFNWKNDTTKDIYFNSYEQAIKKADKIKLKEYEDIVIFDNKTGDELYFRDIEH